MTTPYPTRLPPVPIHTSYPTPNNGQTTGNNSPPSQTAEATRPPSQPGEWNLRQIQAAIKRRLPPELLGTLKDKGNARYLPWYNAIQVLDKYAPGWTWEITSTQLSGDRLFLTGRLSIPTSNGTFFRDSAGTEELKRIEKDTGEIKELAYGDPISNAESMALRRAAAKFGLALYLYEERRNRQ